MNRKNNNNRSARNLGVPPAPEIRSSALPGTNHEAGKKEQHRVHSEPEGEERIHHEVAAFGAALSKEKPALWLLNPQKFPSVLESFRTLKNKIAALKVKDGMNVFLVSGADEKVGTSTVAFNLGLTLSFDFVDQRILIVDANLNHPSLHTAFNLSQHPGLMDFLMKNSQLENVIRNSSYSNLDLITSGRTESGFQSPFDLEAFRNFVAEMSARYDFVLLDSSPVLKSSQTRIISTKIHGVIIVAEANRIRWEVMTEIKRQLVNDGAKLVGSFLNRRKFVIPKWVYRFI